MHVCMHVYMLCMRAYDDGSSQSEVEFFRLMDYEIRRGAQFLALSEGQYVLKTRYYRIMVRTLLNIAPFVSVGKCQQRSLSLSSSLWSEREDGKETWRSNAACVVSAWW